MGIESFSRASLRVRELQQLTGISKNKLNLKTRSLATIEIERVNSNIGEKQNQVTVLSIQFFEQISRTNWPLEVNRPGHVRLEGDSFV